ncbi:hypothetical protein BsWGS_11066 [Bradybaena similaris]
MKRVLTASGGLLPLPMGICCSVEHDDTPLVQCQGHHSLYVYPEDSFSKHTCNIVYRPPYLNERLTPAKVFSIRRHDKDTACCSHQTDNPMVEGSNDLCKKFIKEAEDNSISVKMYPTFLLPCVNKPVRIRLVFMDPKTEKLVGEYSHLKHSKGKQAQTMLEISHLIRHMHSLRLHLTYSSVVQGLPEASLEENHGGVKRLMKVRYRPMPVSWIDLDHRMPTVKVVGEQFELTLRPASPSLRPEDFIDGNGEIPFILGTYVRVLDTCPNRQLKFSARLFRWFNHSVPTECYSDMTTNC